MISLQRKNEHGQYCGIFCNDKHRSFTFLKVYFLFCDRIQNLDHRSNLKY